SAISGASSLTSSDGSAVRPYSALTASASLFWLKAFSGYLSLAAASAGPGPNIEWPSPISAIVTAPCRTKRRVGAGPWSIMVMSTLQGQASCSPSQGLQEIDDRVDLVAGQNAISPERRHHGQRVAPGLIGDDGDEIAAIREFALDVGERRPDGAGKLAAFDVMAGQAVALAAIECQLLTLGNARLRAGRAGARTDQQ